jgi:hypothetical protein
VYKDIALEEADRENLLREIEEENAPFISREVYQRVVQDYEDRICAIEEVNRRMQKAVAREARRDGVQRAAEHVYKMAEEMGNSNMLHAVALALSNVEVNE